MGVVDQEKAHEIREGLLVINGAGFFSGIGDPSGIAPLGSLYIDVASARIWKYVTAGWTLQLADTASPGFSYGRGGNVPAGGFLSRPGSVPSNVTGIIVGLQGPKIVQVNVGSQNLDTWEIGIYQHDGGGVNLALVDTVSVVASASESFDVDIPLTNGKHVAIGVYSGSVQNPGVDLQIGGSIGT